MFVGRSDKFSFICDRLRTSFESSGHKYYYFGHTWNDDFFPLNRDDDISELRKKIFNVDTRIIEECFPFDGFETSSYNFLLDKIEELDFKLPRLKTMFLSYVAQFFSLYKASELTFDFANSHNIKYDAVIKWRYDLLSDNINLSFDYVTDNVLYVDNLGSDVGINDQYFYGSSETMRQICNGCNKFIELFLDSLYYVYLSGHELDTIKKLVEQDKIMYCEKIFKNMCLSLIPDITFNSEPKNLLHTCLVKTGSDPSWSVEQLKDYVEHQWDGMGWDNNILIPSTPMGPLTGKIKL